MTGLKAAMLATSRRWIRVGAISDNSANACRAGVLNISFLYAVFLLWGYRHGM
jgi:hypothetical protein